MKVDNPRFDQLGRVECYDCPCDEDTIPALRGTGICFRFKGADGGSCPTSETYAEACKLAEEVAK